METETIKVVKTNGWKRFAVTTALLATGAALAIAGQQLLSRGIVVVNLPKKEGE